MHGSGFQKVEKKLGLTLSRFLLQGREGSKQCAALLMGTGLSWSDVHPVPLNMSSMTGPKPKSLQVHLTLHFTFFTSFFTSSLHFFTGAGVLPCSLCISGVSAGWHLTHLAIPVPEKHALQDQKLKKSTIRALDEHESQESKASASLAQPAHAVVWLCILVVLQISSDMRQAKIFGEREVLRGRARCSALALREKYA